MTYILNNVGISAIVNGSMLHTSGVNMLIDKNAHQAKMIIDDNDRTRSSPANAIKDEATINCRTLQSRNVTHCSGVKLSIFANENRGGCNE